MWHPLHLFIAVGLNISDYIILGNQYFTNRDELEREDHKTKTEIPRRCRSSHACWCKPHHPSLILPLTVTRFQIGSTIPNT